MRRYELPLDQFLIALKKVLNIYGVKHLWSYGEFNGFSAMNMSSMFCDSNAEAAKAVTDFFSSYDGFHLMKVKPVCALISSDIKPLLNEVYVDGKFFSALKDADSLGICSGVVLSDNNFLTGFRDRLKACGVDYVWVDCSFDGEKKPGVFYNVDSYEVPWSLCEYVDPNVDIPDVTSDDRSYCIPTRHIIQSDMNLIYDKGVFYKA